MSTKITIELDTGPGDLDPKPKHVYYLDDELRYVLHADSDWYQDREEYRGDFEYLICHATEWQESLDGVDQEP